MFARTAFVAVLVLLPALCLAQSVDPLDGLKATSLAPFAGALDANAPLAAAVLGVPYFQEIANNPDEAAESPDITFLLNDPQVIAAINQTPKNVGSVEAVAAYESALPPAVLDVFLDSAAVPTTGDVLADTERHVNGYAPLAAARAAIAAGYGGRKMLQT